MFSVSALVARVVPKHRVSGQSRLGRGSHAGVIVVRGRVPVQRPRTARAAASAASQSCVWAKVSEPRSIAKATQAIKGIKNTANNTSVAPRLRSARGRRRPPRREGRDCPSRENCLSSRLPLA